MVLQTNKELISSEKVLGEEVADYGSPNNLKFPIHESQFLKEYNKDNPGFIPTFQGMLECLKGLEFIVNNPASQLTGSFHPVHEDWYKQLYSYKITITL